MDDYEKELRDTIALDLLKIILRVNGLVDVQSTDSTIVYCYKLADAMMRARKTNEPKQSESL